MNSKFLIVFAPALCAAMLAACSSEAEFASSGAKSYDQVASEVFNFKSSKIVPQTMLISDGGRYTALEITQAERAPSQVIQRQLRRQSYSESFLQGHAARYTEEEFQLSEAGRLDFLVVVDNSRSMSDERDMVGRGLTSLISEFKDTDWQIAVISMSNPCIDSSNLIKKSDSNASAKFADAVKKSVDWQATEQGFPMAIRAIRGQCNGATRSWLRDDSTLGILFISDEDNCGSDPGEQSRCANVEGKNADEMVNALRLARPADQGRLYAIVDKDGSCPDAGGIGSMYVEALNKTGGTVGSICHDFNASNGYGDYLSRVSKDVSRIIKRQFKLSSTPDMAQFNVFVDGKISSAGVISVNGNVVTIDPAQFKDGLKIKFGYSHDAVPMFSELPLKVAPSPDTIKVAMNNAVLNSGVDYSYLSQTRTIKFTAMPPEDAKIAISYLEDKKLATRFPVNLSGLRPDTLKVSVNGIVSNLSDFNYDNAGIEFATPPIDGAVITVSWRTEEHKITAYDARLADARRPVSWATTEKSTGEAVPSTWDGTTLRFSSDQIVEGRVVVFTADFGEKSQLRSVTLPSERIDDDVSILADGKPDACSALPPPGPDPEPKEGETNSQPAKNLEEPQTTKAWQSRYKGRSLYLKCLPGIDYSQLQIRYKHEIERTGSFIVKLPTDVDTENPLVGWKVYVDGVKTTDFQRSGAEILLDKDALPPETRVDVEVITYKLINK